MKGLGCTVGEGSGCTVGHAPPATRRGKEGWRSSAEGGCGMPCAYHLHRKVEVKLPGQGNGARPVQPIITTIEWILTSRLSIKKSLYITYDGDTPLFCSAPCGCFLGGTLLMKR